MAMRFCGAHTLTTAGTNGYVKFWNTVTHELEALFNEPDNEIFALDYSGDKTMFATAGKDRAVRVYDATTTQRTRIFDEKESKTDPEHVFCLRFHPTDTNVCVTGGWSHNINFWDVRIPKRIRQIHGPQICGEGIDVDEKQVLTASWTKDEKTSLQLWDVRFAAREPINIAIDAPNGPYLYCGQMSRKADLIAAGGSGTKDCRLFTRSTGAFVQSLALTDAVKHENKVVQALDLSLDGKYLAFAGSTPDVRLVELKQ